MYARLLACALALHALPAQAAQRVWIGGALDWTNGGSALNWNPADEPDADDEAVFNAADSVNLGSDNAVNGITMSAGADLLTNDFSLAVDGLVQLSGAGTNLFVGDATGGVNADNVTINSGATVELTGGLLTLDEESGTSVLDVNAGGSLQGHGVITFADTPLLSTTLLVNDGTLTALSRGVTILSPPPVGSLVINDSSLGGRVNLDGVGEAGVVSVNRNQTLDLNVPFSDAFSGTLNLAQSSVFDSVGAWTLDAGAITVNNGATGGLGGAPAGTAYIAGGAFTQTGGTITVLDADGALQLDAPATLSGGALVINGLLVFNNDATLSIGATTTMPTTSSSITVAAGRFVTVTQNNFDLDGGNSSANVITVNAGGLLSVNTTDYDPDSATNRYDGTINLNGGDFTVTSSDAEFVMDGSLNMDSAAPGQIAVWSGEPLDIGNDVGAHDARVRVTVSGGGGVSRFNAPVDFNSDADVLVDAGAQLQFNQLVNFDTVNAAANAAFAGAGELAFSGPVNVNEAVTLNMAGGAVDLDGVDGVGDLINVDAPLVINAATLRSFGRVNDGGGVNTLDVDALAHAGSLTVTLDDPGGSWTLNPAGVLNLTAQNATIATLLSGADATLNGTVNATGAARSNARVDIGGAVNILTAGGATGLYLAGGSLAKFNTLSGGVVNGPGQLRATSGRSLRGFGTINAGIDFDGTAALLAVGGTLTVNGGIADVGTIGTTGGTLNVTNAWNTGVANSVLLSGGTLAGGVVTVAGGTAIQGHGLVTSRVVNGGTLGATSGASLVFQTAGNDNDWDGGADNGVLTGAGATLELRDNAGFAFGGTVHATTGGRVFTNGFALDFNAGSTLELQDSTYESTASTDLAGAVSILAGSGAASTIKIENNRFLTFESTSVTTLGQDLRLENNNIIIDAGAAFSGAGALRIPSGSHLSADNLASIGVLLLNEGAIRPAGFDGIGRVDVAEYQQTDTGQLFAEIEGTALNAYDRLVVGGNAVIDGYLHIDIDGGFVPSLGQTFNIITAAVGVIGEFETVDMAGMPAGLTFHLNYLSNAVQLQVVNTPFFAADFDHDGDVDTTDYSIWRGAYGLNQLGDANGDNLSNAADYTIWRDTFGSSPAPEAALDAGRVPEPATAILLGAALAGACAVRRRGRRPFADLRAHPRPARG